MAKQNTPTQNASTSAPVTMAKFLQNDKVSKFLTENLADKKVSFVANLLAMTDSDSKLAECSPDSLMKCAMNATALDLPLNKNLGYAYIIPYKGIPSFQIGYKGFIQLAIRSGQYETINSTPVREGEIKFDKFTGKYELLGDFPENDIVGYLAHIELRSGFSKSLYMTEAQIESHARRYSQVYKSDLKYKNKASKWSDPEDRPKMAEKTVLKALLSKYGVLSIELQKALSNDNDSEDDQSYTGPRINIESETIPSQSDNGDQANYEGEDDGPGDSNVEI